MTPADIQRAIALGYTPESAQYLQQGTTYATEQQAQAAAAAASQQAGQQALSTNQAPSVIDPITGQPAELDPATGYYKSTQFAVPGQYGYYSEVDQYGRPASATWQGPVDPTRFQNNTWPQLGPGASPSGTPPPPTNTDPNVIPILQSLWHSWADVPQGEKDLVSTLALQFEQDTGFFYEFNNNDLYNLAVWGALTQQDVGRYVEYSLNDPKNTRPNKDKLLALLKDMPWASLGLTKDQYRQLSLTYGTEYKRITGQDITPEALAKAFASANLLGLGTTGGQLSASQFAEQLMNDAAIQKQFGWVKYGLDFSQWTQQKLSMRTAFGRDINDAEASTVLQFNKSASGANLAAVARGPGGQQQQPSALGVAGSVAR